MTLTLLANQGLAQPCIYPIDFVVKHPRISLRRCPPSGGFKHAEPYNIQLCSKLNSRFPRKLIFEQPLDAPDFGGAEEDRTPDPLLAKQVLSQLSYSPILYDYGGPG